jgi:hypothetical protein
MSARNLVAVCEDKLIPWDLVDIGIEPKSKIAIFPDALISDLRVSKAKRIIDWKKARDLSMKDGSLPRIFSLDFLLDSFSDQECQDPRDKIFGVLGIVSQTFLAREPQKVAISIEATAMAKMSKVPALTDVHNSVDAPATSGSDMSGEGHIHPISADYSKSVEGVYRDALRHIFSQQNISYPRDRDSTRDFCVNLQKVMKVDGRHKVVHSATEEAIAYSTATSVNSQRPSGLLIRISSE